MALLDEAHSQIPYQSFSQQTKVCSNFVNEQSNLCCSPSLHVTQYSFPRLKVGMYVVCSCANETCVSPCLTFNTSLGAGSWKH